MLPFFQKNVSCLLIFRSFDFSNMVMSEFSHIDSYELDHSSKFPSAMVQCCFASKIQSGEYKRRFSVPSYWFSVFSFASVLLAPLRFVALQTSLLWRIVPDPLLRLILPDSLRSGFCCYSSPTPTLRATPPKRGIRERSVQEA